MVEIPDRDALLALVAGGKSLPVGEQLPRLVATATALAAEGLEPRLRLSLLEELRLPLWQVLRQFEQQELARALPFSAAELRRWRDYIEGWSALLGAYLSALAEAERPDGAMGGLLPLLLQRVLRQAVQVAVACYRAYQPVEPSLWLLVHEHLRRAEKAGVADIAVADPTVDLEARGTVHEAWLHLLLLDFCDPYGFAPAQLVLASRWTERLARLARVSLEAVSHGPAGFLVVDLERGEGMQLRAQAPDPARADRGLPRFVELRVAREQVKRQLAKLRLGIAPVELFLAGDCTRDEAEQVLERMYRRWRTSRRRAHPRRAVDEAVRIAPGLAAVHRYLAHLEAGLPADQCPGLSEARLVDQSPSGLGLVQGEAAQRFRCHQVVALARRREVLLGSVRWLTQEARGGLRFGVRLLAGRATAASLRGTDAGEPAAPALLLPAMEVLELPPTLVAAPGTFWPGRELQLASPGADWQPIRLERLLESGIDFERISWHPAG